VGHLGWFPLAFEHDRGHRRDARRAHQTDADPPPSAREESDDAPSGEEDARSELAQHPDGCGRRSVVHQRGGADRNNEAECGESEAEPSDAGGRLHGTTVTRCSGPALMALRYW
jgi:hypothetical protein